MALCRWSLGGHGPREEHGVKGYIAFMCGIVN
jgi:hypothetical protein